MIDLVIRNGTIVDGTGAPRFRGDIAIDRGRIVAVGTVAETGRSEVDAAGDCVAPGFIDPHTHYDAQITWDGLASCSSWHGVTSVVIGNCGFGIAPCRSSERRALIQMLERTEGMSPECLEAGIRWQFETFPEYLASLRGLGVNVAALVPHSTLRQFVMGNAAWERAANSDELAMLERALEEALRAGAVGLGTSTHKSHVGADGRAIPSRVASEAEIAAMARVMGRVGRGTLQIARDAAVGVDASAPFLVDLARSTGRPVTYTSLRQDPSDPAKFRSVLRQIEALDGEGVHLYPQVSASPLLVHFAMDSPYPFYRVPAWKRVFDAAPDDWPRIFADPVFRDDFRRSLAVAGRSHVFAPGSRLLRVHKVASPRLQVHVGRPVAAIDPAKDPVDAFFDLVLADELRCEFEAEIMNTDEGAVAEILAHPMTLLALSDAGAHATLLCEAGQTSFVLGYWVRERRVLSLEDAVRKMTTMPATVYGIEDRGRIAVGLAADIVIFDPDTIAAEPPEIVNDLPAGSPRYVQRSRGIRWSFVNGTPIIRNGEMPTTIGDLEAGVVLGR